MTRRLSDVKQALGSVRWGAKKLWVDRPLLRVISYCLEAFPIASQAAPNRR